MISIENLSFSKGRTAILRNVGFTITQGDVVLLAGRNGAGKTTLLKCLLGIEKNYTGRIVFHTELGGLRPCTMNRAYKLYEQKLLIAMS